MGSSERRKGRDGQAEAARLLTSRDWSLIETTSGKRVEDIIATDPQGRTWSVEVKKQKVIDPARFLAQAREQARARKLPYMAVCKIHATRSWLVLRYRERPQVWHEREET